jgi:hypothetical protein
VAVFAEKPGWHLVRATLGNGRAGDVIENAEVVLRRDRTVTVRVAGADGRPVSGALVRADGLEPIRAGTFESSNSASTGLTGPDGIIELGGIVPQSVRISVRVPGRLPWVETREIPVGDKPAIDLGEVRLTPGLAVAGRIRSTAGALPEGLEILVASGDLSQSVPVGRDGTFRCTGLPEGRLNLRVKAPDHEMLLVPIEAGDENVELVITALCGLSILIDRPDGLDLDGRLDVKPLTGRVRDRIPMFRTLRGGVDAYHFKNLLAGDYLVSIRSGDHYAVARVTLEHGKTRELPMVLRRGAVLRGRITLPDGTAAARIGVTLDLGEGRGTLTRVSDGEGSFEFRGAAPGPAVLRSHPMGYPPVEKTIELAAEGDTTADLTLAEGGHIRVRVRDAEGRSVAGSRVGLATAAGTPARYWIRGGGRPQTGDDGTVTLTGIEPGQYVLSVFRDGSPRPWGKVSVEEGRTAEVEVTLK